MRPVGDISQVREGLGRVKRQPGYTTNLFAPPAQLADWAARGLLLLEEQPRAVLLLRRDRDFHHLYHAAASQDALAAALCADSAWPDTDLACDLIGRAAQITETADTYRACGFADYQSLLRLQRNAATAPADADDARVTAGTEQDADAVLAFLTQYLDPLVEQVPELHDLRQAAASGELLLVREGDALQGILVSESTGLTTLLRYWFVRRGNHSRGIGALLIKSMFRRMRAGSRVLLWVIAGNQDALDKYHHYGFAADGMVDRVLVRKKGVRI